MGCNHLVLVCICKADIGKTGFPLESAPDVGPEEAWGRAEPLWAFANSLLCGSEASVLDPYGPMDTLDSGLLVHVDRLTLVTTMAKLAIGMDELQEEMRSSAQVHNATENARKWAKRLRSLTPKVLSTSALLRVNEEWISDPERLEEAYRAHREKLWTTKPPLVAKFAVPALREYRRQLPCHEPAPWPTQQDFVDAISLSPDTAQGEDGLPYALYRLAPQAAAKMFEQIIADLANGGPHGALHTWEQLLVWIPKTQNASTPEDMRPLGLPPTMIRLIAKVLYHVLDKAWSRHMCQAQALVAAKKDALLPFVRAEAHLHQALELTSQGRRTKWKMTPSPLRAVLLADLTKAFEKVGIEWIVLVFAQWAPSLAWFNLMAGLLTARILRFKIGAQRGGTIALQCGVDMGNGLSPWLFCLSLDPLLAQLQHLSGALSANMDDVTVPVRGVQKLARAQKLITRLGNCSGLTVAPHHCKKGLLWGPHPKRKGMLAMRKVQGPSWHSLLQSLRPRDILFQAGELRLTPPKGGMWTPEQIALLATLQLECRCKTKQAVVLDHPVTSAIRNDLEALPCGAASLQDSARLLGYTLAARAPGRKMPAKWASQQDWAKVRVKIRSRYATGSPPSCVPPRQTLQAFGAGTSLQSRVPSTSLLATSCVSTT